MLEKLVTWFGGEAKTVAFALLSGVIGFLAKSIYDLWSARREERLERVNQQLRLLYGPLYALNLAGGLAWSAFRSRVRPGGSFFREAPPPSEQELEAWRLWMRKVFQPINAEMLTLITKNADLLVESDLPKSLQLFCAHVTAYQVVLERWANNDFSDHVSVINYPEEEMNVYLSGSFQRLKAEQHALLGSSKRR